MSDKPFALTPKQSEALALIRTTPDVVHYAFPGGSRSGKTFFIMHLIFIRGLKYAGSRHIVCRLRFSHAKTALWMDTVPKVLRCMGLREGTHYKLNRTDFVVTFKNGSEVFIDGLDDSTRVEKILGREFCTIFFDEVSQIPYDTVTTVMSRLAMYVESEEYGVCRNMALYALNPGLKSHWSYQLWYLKKDPVKKVALSEAEAKTYKHFQMNPGDNIDNLNPKYLEILAGLPEKKRLRFLAGEYGDVDGQIFENYTVIPFVPDEIKAIAVQTLGIDFGFSVDPAAAVQCWFVRNRYKKSQLYIEQLAYGLGMTNSKLGQAVLDGLRNLWKQRLIAEYGETDKSLEYDEFLSRRENNGGPEISGTLYCYADCAEPKSIVELDEFFRGKVPRIEVLPALKGRDSIMAGIDWMQELEIFITASSPDVIAEFDSYEYEKDIEGKALPTPIDDFNHCIPGHARIAVRNGTADMSSIVVGDEVLTRNGYKKVLRHWSQGKQPTIRVNGLPATGNHDVVINGVFCALDTARYGDILLSVCKEKQPRTRGKYFIAIQSHLEEQTDFILRKVLLTSIAWSMKSTSDQSQRGGMCTIKMGIQAIMSQIILQHVTRKIMLQSMKNTEHQSILRVGDKTWIRYESLLKHGTRLLKGMLGIASTDARRMPQGRHAINSACTVEKNLILQNISKNIVQTLVNLLQEDNLVLMMRRGAVRFAIKNSAQTNIPRQSFALELVHTLQEGYTEEVFDITVEDKHEFFANGYCVSNCIDGTRYACSNHIGRNTATIVELGAS